MVNSNKNILGKPTSIYEVLCDVLSNISDIDKSTCKMTMENE